MTEFSKILEAQIAKTTATHSHVVSNIPVVQPTQTARFISTVDRYRSTQTGVNHETTATK